MTSEQETDRSQPGSVVPPSRQGRPYALLVLPVVLFSLLLLGLIPPMIFTSAELPAPDPLVAFAAESLAETRALGTITGTASSVVCHGGQHLALADFPQDLSVTVIAVERIEAAINGDAGSSFTYEFAVRGAQGATGITRVTVQCGEGGR